MADKIYRSPDRQSGSTGGEEPDRLKEGSPVRTEGLPAEENRGRKAPRDGSGAVIGSGAGAGGGDEGFDSDPQAGGGNMDMERDGPRPDKGGDGPSHGSR